MGELFLISIFGLIIGSFLGLYGSQSIIYRNVDSNIWQYLPKWQRWIYRLEDKASRSPRSYYAVKYRNTDRRLLLFMIIMFLLPAEILSVYSRDSLNPFLVTQIVWVLPHLLGFFLAFYLMRVWLLKHWLPSVANQ